MKKMKVRLDAFSDAIIAIIITIMVLELPDIVHNTSGEYIALGRAVVIYLISFCFVATLWVQHASMFNAVESIDNKVLVLDLIFLALLSLTPLATKTIYSDITNFNVMGYGILMIVVQIVLLALEYAITGCQQEWQQELIALFRRLHRFRSFSAIGINVVLILLAYRHPRVVVILYFINIVFSFVSTTLSRKELHEIETLNVPEQEALMSLDTKDLRIARKQMMEQVRQTRKETREELKNRKNEIHKRQQEAHNVRKKMREQRHQVERHQREDMRNHRNDKK